MRPKTSVTVGALALAYGLAGGAQAGTLQDVQARGTLNCVVSTGIAGFAYPDDAGEWHGFDIDFCRATAAAVLGDPNAIKAVTSTGKTRFTKLNAGEGDVLWRNTTITFSRDVGVNPPVAKHFYPNTRSPHKTRGIQAASACGLSLPPVRSNHPSNRS